MRPDAARQLRQRLGPWSKHERITDRRGSQVWRVHLSDDTRVAVKVAGGDGPAAVLPAREAAVVQAAGPVAGTVLGSGWLPDGGSWMATPWRDGPTLAARCAALRADPTDGLGRHRAAAAGAAAARAVADLHTAGWAHGDLQGGHIVHTPSRVHLLDLAWAHSPAGVLPEVLEPPYAGALVHLEAPEIARGFLDGAPTRPTPAADVYSLAAVLWSCCTGTWPVDYQAAGVDPARGNPTAKRQAVAAGRRRPLTALAWSGLGRLLDQALANMPGDRPTAGEFAEHLDALAKEAW